MQKIWFSRRPVKLFCVYCNAPAVKVNIARTVYVCVQQDTVRAYIVTVNVFGEELHMYALQLQKRFMQHIVIAVSVEQ